MTKRRKWLSCLLSFILVMTLLPTAALAEGQTHVWNAATDMAWDNVGSGDTIKLGENFAGAIHVPESISTLTVDGQGHVLSDTSIIFDVALKFDVAAANTDLTIKNLQIVSATDQYGITIPGNSRLTVEGICAVSSGANRAQYSQNSYGEPSAIACTGLDEGSLSITLKTGSALTATGGDNTAENKYGGHGIVNRCYDGETSITIEEGAELWTAGGKSHLKGVTCGLNSGGPVALNNNGTAGLFSGRQADGMTPSCYGIWAGGRGITIAGAGETTAWGRYGMSTLGPLVIEEGVKGTAFGELGGMYGNPITNHSNQFFEQKAGMDDTDYSTIGLDLTEVTKSTYYPKVGGNDGYALWVPGTGEETALLTLKNVNISVIGTSSGIALKLPYRNVEITSLGENGLFGVYGISVEQGDVWDGEKTLTLRGDGILAAIGTNCGIRACGDAVLLEGELRAEGPDGALQVWNPAIKFDGAPNGPVGDTVIINPTTLTPAHYGEAEAGVPEIGSAPANIRTLFGGRFWSPQTYIAPTEQIDGVYQTPDTYFRAQISEGEQPYNPVYVPDSYAVVYKSNYENGPKDVRDGGYAQNKPVTVKGGDLFDPPAGMVFLGWAETAGGPVAYRPGDSFKMPSRNVTLYALWSQGDPAPGLNKTEHFAYVQGYPDGEIKPQGNITREETAMLFYRLLDGTTRAYYETGEHPFQDVEAGRWSERAIATLYAAGIVTGRSGAAFDPGAPITRAEFASIAARFDPETYSGADLFPDIAGHWAREEINRAARKGWVVGDENGNFRPDAYITRAEAVTLINRMLERLPETAADLLSGMKTFPDNADPAAWYYLALQEAANGHDYTRKTDSIHESWTALKED